MKPTLNEIAEGVANVRKWTYQTAYKVAVERGASEHDANLAGCKAADEAEEQFLNTMEKVFR